MTILHLHTELPQSAKGKPPVWLHLLPAGEFRGTDGRGPFRSDDPAAIILASMERGRIVLDENHSTDRAMVSGGAAPAVGWIVEMQARADGVWGRVDWTRSGAALVADRAYSGLSPAFSAPGGVVNRIHRASLTNAPNLSLTPTLHNQEPRMDLAEIRRRLGLPETATQSDVETALDGARTAIQLHSQIATAAGLPANATGQELVTGISARMTGAGQRDQQVQELQTQIATLQQDGRVRAATEVVDAAIREGRVIPEAMRTQLIQLHTTNADMVNGLITGMPVLKPVVGLHTRIERKTQGNAGGEAEQVAKLLCVKVEDVQAGLGGNA